MLSLGEMVIYAKERVLSLAEMVILTCKGTCAVTG